LNIALLARLVAWLLKKGWCSFRVDDTLEGVEGLKILTLDEMKVHCTLYILTTGDSWMHENIPGLAAHAVEIVRT